MGKILLGKPAAENVLDRVRQRLAQIQGQGLRMPKLAVIQVGDDPASTVYVRNKIKTCEKLGIARELFRLEKDVEEDELLRLVEKLSADEEVSGILVQLPLPEAIDADKVMERINPLKDVDCLHPENVGRLWLGKPFVKPCTPAGIIELLEFYGISLDGKRAVIIGRSNIVGKPLLALMLQKNATVTICHTRTKELKEVARGADVLVVAAGRARLVGADFVRQGAVVIDVGVNREVSEKGEERLVGDVDFEAVKEKVYAISPVPGGVGPMTIAMLMNNVIACYEGQKKEVGA